MKTIKKLDARQLYNESIHIRETKDIMDIGLHWHSYFELIYYFEGDAVSEINGTMLELHPGSLYLLTPLDMHHTQAKTPSSKAHFLNISFTEEAIDRELHSTLQRAIYMHNVGQNPNIYPLILLLQNTKVAKEKQYLLNTLLYRITASGQQLQSAPNNELPDCIQQCIRYISAGFQSPITLASAAAHVHLNPAYLSDLFSKTCNCTFKTYLTEFRLSYAKQLLRNSDLTVTEIASQSGFQTLAHFLRTFKEKMGITPMQFRKKSP